MPLKVPKILLVENDPDHAELIIDVIEKECKRKVILKRDGREAMDYFWRNGTFGQSISAGADEKERCCQLDLVILDLNLPKVHGMGILGFLKRDPMYRSIPVVIVSTSSDEKTIEEAYENGAAEFVTKSTSFPVFVENIKLLSDYVSNASTTTSIESFYDNPDNVDTCAAVLFEGNIRRRNVKHGTHG